ncbi:ATP-binding cassette domain-containing protein [Roseiconus lacunae]|uniref:ABC transporter ATP-binding protein n=1 Tax=Roseiconus lacunae TaxID=2605694 RepID=A0ABT7PPZ0_9BACT|nr:ABC transporter ATP-binding protein [Roseiconus lacunae]MCD0461846.1 ABC transporter ATP-binding protein/permease [Roseiconus lacunae]MDM4018557.1 ABC transporter ATP-binding protein [Roseiconus lacunae]WRQ52612.1 ABC transporter ATP-binding protein [Stieleria sp. HD01]
MNRFQTLSAARHEPEGKTGSLTYFIWAVLAGILVPVLVLVFGLISYLLETKAIDSSPVRLGVNLYVPLPESFLDQRELVQLTQLTSLAFFISVLFCLAVWRHRRVADRRAMAITKSLHYQVLKQSVRRAELEGAAAQSASARALIGRHLPSLGRGLSLWYRVVPRSVLLLLGCVAVALLVHVYLAIIAVISGVMMWRLYQHVRGTDVEEVGRWELPQLRDQIAGLVARAPQMARLQASGIAEESFRHEVDQLYHSLDSNDARRGRIWPTLFLAASSAIGIMVIGLGLNLLAESEYGLSLSSAVVLGLSLAGAFSAVWRILSLGRNLRTHSGPACDSIYAYLKRSSEATPSEQRVGLAGLRDGVEFRDVSLFGSHGQPILNHITTGFKPKSLAVLLGTDQVSTQAMAEMLMGFGRPATGEVRIDGLKLLDVHPASLAKNVMWVDPTGPLWDGTIEENLAGGDSEINSSDIVAALREVDVYEQISRLPEGLTTYASVEDKSLSTEATYGIGLARALLHRPPILLVSEPPAVSTQLDDDPCLKTLQKLAGQGSLVVVLPRRLQTLRSADRVILLNGADLAGEGRHADLLNDSDLYRHLNYLLFNPYRSGARVG